MNSFIEKITEQFYETDHSLIKRDFAFKDADEWNSLTALLIIAMIDEEYGVKITADELRSDKVKTVEDLFNLVMSKL